MNDALFAKDFSFNEFRFSRYRHTDNRGGAAFHYIGYMREGTVRLVGADQTLDLGAGEFFYIPDGYSYQSYWRGEDTIRFDSYGFRYFPRADGQRYPMQRIAPDAQSLDLLARLAADKRRSCTSIGLFYQLLGYLTGRMTVLPESRMHGLADRAESYIYDHPDASAGEIAAHCGVSESTLYSAFREARGYTPTQARHRTLADRAIRLLTTTDLPVETVSEQLGFSSAIYFRRILMEQTGKTPRAIRKERGI